MPEHRIRLRGAWDWSPTDGEGRPAGKVALPLTTIADLPPRFRLDRKFGRPPFDPATESLRLDLADVPGLIGVALNGVDLPERPTVGGDLSIPLDDLPARNLMTLDVDLASASFEPPWGSIALVIEAKGDRGGATRYNGGPRVAERPGIVEAG